MKAVILAAGKGTRMEELTRFCPKPLLKIKDKTLLEYKMDILSEECSEIIIIIGYLGNEIKKYFGDKYKGKKLTYISAEPYGTAFALWQAKNYLKEPFIVMCGDDLYTKKDIDECLKHSLASLVFKTTEAQSGGKVYIENGLIQNIEEGNHDAGSIIATGLYVLNPEMFNLEMVKIKGKDEYGLPQTLMNLGKGSIRAVYASAWHQVTSAKDLDISEEKLKVFQ